MPYAENKTVRQPIKVPDAIRHDHFANSSRSSYTSSAKPVHGCARGCKPMHYSYARHISLFANCQTLDEKLNVCRLCFFVARATHRVGHHAQSSNGDAERKAKPDIADNCDQIKSPAIHPGSG